MPFRNYKASSFNGLPTQYDSNLYQMMAPPQDSQVMSQQYSMGSAHPHEQQHPSQQQETHQQQPPPLAQHEQGQQQPALHGQPQQQLQQFIGLPPNFSVYQRASEPHFVVQPRLVRASSLAQQQQQENQSGSSPRNNSWSQQLDSQILNVKVTVSLRGDIQSMVNGWTEEERRTSRRLVLISWSQEYSHLSLSFRPISQKDYIPGMPVLSCIYWDETDKFYVTSVDLITLLEHLVHARFPVEEKNRIRRNLQSLKPMTVTKGNDRFHNFFQLIMQYDSPKPRHIEKDVKVLYWSAIEDALCKVLSKYTVDPFIDSPSQQMVPQPHMGMPEYHQESIGPHSHMSQPQYYQHGHDPQAPPPPQPGHFSGFYPPGQHYGAGMQYHHNTDPLTPAHSSHSITPTHHDPQHSQPHYQMGYTMSQPQGAYPVKSEDAAQVYVPGTAEM